MNTEITVGNLVAACAALISAAAVIATLSKERALRKKELADRVRQSASLVAAKLDRWKQIALQAFDQLQTVVTEADAHLLKDKDEIQTRDMFWKEVVTVQASLSKSVLDEEIEIAYSNLFGYDPKIHELFTTAVSRLRHVESLVFVQLLNRTQHEILTARESQEQLLSAHLGNKLRFCLAESRGLLEAHMESVISKFREAMSALVAGSDDALVDRSIAVPSSDTLPGADMLSASLYEAPPDNDMRSCKRLFSDTRLSSFGGKMFEPWPLGVVFPEDNKSPAPWRGGLTPRSSGAPTAGHQGPV